jgi:hypothetical protein
MLPMRHARIVAQLRTMGTFMLFLALAAGDAGWLASLPAAEFRGRVVQLALIYGDSSGIDLQDFKVQARKTSKEEGGCADVEVVTSKRERVVRRETVHACRSH